MTKFDIAVIVVLLFSFFYSIMRGMVREIFSLLGYIGGIFVAIRYHGTLAVQIGEVIPNMSISRLIGFVVVFFAVVFLVGLLGMAVRAVMNLSSVISGLDRLMGGAVGIVKGIFLLAIFVIIVEFFPDFERQILHGSVFAPHLKQFSNTLSSMVGREYSLDRFTGETEKQLRRNLEVIQKLDKLSDNIKITSRNSKTSGEEPQDTYTSEEKNQMNRIIQSHNQN